MLFYRPLTNGSKLLQLAGKGQTSEGASRVLMAISIVKDLWMYTEWDGYKVFMGYPLLVLLALG